MSTWDYMMPQSELTLNLVRGSRINPKLSAWEQLKGRYDFNKTPIAPPGVKILAHVRSTARRTWKSHALEGWYMGPAMEHYRCYTAYIPSTGKTRIVDTISWFPKKVAMPIATKEDLMRAALEDLTNAIKDPEQGTLAGNLPPSATEHLQELTEILTNANNTAAEAQKEETIEEPLVLTPRVRFTSDTKSDTQHTRQSHTQHPRPRAKDTTSAPATATPPPALRVQTATTNEEAPQSPKTFAQAAATPPPALRVQTKLTPERKQPLRVLTRPTEAAAAESTPPLRVQKETTSVEPRQVTPPATPNKEWHTVQPKQPRRSERLKKTTTEPAQPNQARQSNRKQRANRKKARQGKTAALIQAPTPEEQTFTPGPHGYANKAVNPDTGELNERSLIHI